MSWPIDVDELIDLLLTGSFIQPWRMPIPPSRSPAAVKAERRKPPRRVLVVDEDSTTAMLLASCKVVGGTPFYRLLWNAHPELKHRFVFIARAEAAPASTTSGRAAPVVERPLTRDVITALLERFATS